MSNTERFTPREGWLLVLTIFLASTSVTLLLLNATYTAQAQSEVDKNLADLARRIKLHFAAEMTLSPRAANGTFAGRTSNSPNR